MATADNKISLPYIDRSKVVRLFWLIAISGALGGFAAGYDTGVIGDAINVISIKLTTEEIGLTASGLLLGALFSSIIAGQISDILGRKWILVFDAIIFTLMPILLALATFNFATFMAWRVIEGFALGMDNVLAGIFIGEMVPTGKRNKYIATQQLMTVIGAFLSFWIGYALTFSLDWRLMFALGAIPAAIILIIRFRIPESPRWLISANKPEKAKSVIKNSFKVDIIDEEFDNLYKAIKKEVNHEGTWKDVFSKDMRKYAFIAIIIGLFVQFSGINTFIFYSPEIFVHLGYSKINAAFTSGWSTGLAELWPVFLAEFLLINRMGTKKAFLMGAAGMFTSMIVSSVFLLELHGTALGTATIVLIFLFLFFFEAGYGVALWAFSPEIFPTNIRGRGTSLFMTADSLAGFIVTGTFPTMLSRIGLAYTMDIYGIITIIAFVFMLIFMPNRKNKPLLEGNESIE
ncbi:sugar porter family MFS transporter [Ferroplasma sp.]|uniref:sugar porter family MFS transporter n=1 Tax=Ferroplasma sp. TaxID=2591003 RepID=UPI00260E7D4E|nr:sugar porter family MFS transporter [Ferroplasma sp.]